MELINNTAVAVNTLIAEGFTPEHRSLLGIAKATFRITKNGKVELDRNDPMPIYTKDVETRFGVLPREDIPRLDPVFEVMVLGSAYAPNGHPVNESQVSLQVGQVHQTMQVFGDRVWEGEGDNVRISAATPFTKQALGWHLAFGGSEEVEIDEDSFIDVSDPINTLGKGFNYQPQIDDLAKLLKCPDSYPRFHLPRPLPNIESPSDRVVQQGDAPLPICWAPCEGSSGILVERIRRAQKAAGVADEQQVEASLESPLVLHRAHPDWVIEPPLAGSTIRLEGMTKSGVFEFQLPDMRVLFDVSVSNKTRELELHPNALTLFPDLGKFTLVFRGTLPYHYRPEDERSARVRLQQGWVPARPTSTQRRRAS